MQTCSTPTKPLGREIVSAVSRPEKLFCVLFQARGVRARCAQQGALCAPGLDGRPQG